MKPNSSARSAGASWNSLYALSRACSSWFIREYLFQDGIRPFLRNWIVNQLARIFKLPQASPYGAQFFRHRMGSHGINMKGQPKYQIKPRTMLRQFFACGLAQY